MVEPEAPRAPRWRREGGAAAPSGLEEQAGLDGAFPLPAIGATLAVADLYDRTSLTPEAQA